MTRFLAACLVCSLLFHSLFPLPSVAQNWDGSVRVETQVVSLAEPTLDAESGQDDRQRIEAILGGLRYRQFARDSVVAPVRIDLEYLKDEAGERIGHRVAVAFIVHCSLEVFESESLSDKLLVSSRDGDKSFHTVPTDELRSRGISDGGQGVQYHRLNVDLLERVRLNGVLRVEQHRGPRQYRLDIKLDERFDNRWQSLDEPQQAGSYRGFGGWITATRIEDGTSDDDDRKVLIEARFAIHEPVQWFRGSNFLRSKLPLALQEAARKMRRDLVQQ